jgi:hypothetical protein
VFKKFFGKKNDGFFLQLENEDATSKPEIKAKAKDPVPAPAVIVTKDTAPAVGTTGEADQKVAKAEEKTTKAAKKSAEKAETPKVVADPAPMAPVITNFATDYLIKPSSISGRRRPGANMKGFLELARQVEKPKSFKATASERKAEK